MNYVYAIAEYDKINLENKVIIVITREQDDVEAMRDYCRLKKWLDNERLEKWEECDYHSVNDIKDFSFACADKVLSNPRYLYCFSDDD